jgi:hypothetical protein
MLAVLYGVSGLESMKKLIFFFWLKRHRKDLDNVEYIERSGCQKMQRFGKNIEKVWIVFSQAFKYMRGGSGIKCR